MRNPTLGRRARNAQRSKSPGLWRGQTGAWVPALGNQGARLFDFSGNGNHGTLTNMPPDTAWVVGEKGYALDFDGTDDRVVLADDVGSSQGTISAWVKPAFDYTATTIQRFIIGTDSTSKVLDLYYAPAGTGAETFRGHYRGNFGARIEPRSRKFLDNADLQRWHHVVFVWDRTWGGEIYVDGVDDGTPSMVSTANAWGPTTTSWIGCDPTNASKIFQGEIASVQIFNRVLAPAEIKALYGDLLATFRLRPERFGFVGGGGGPTLKSIAEAAGSSESLQIAVSLALSELGSGGDTPKIDSAVQIPDTGSGSESPGVVADIPVSESGFSVESIEIPGQIGITDSGSATETINVIAALAVPDTGSGVEIIDIAAQVAITENGTGSEALKVDVTLALTELGLGLDTLSLLAAIAQADTGAGTEGLTANTLSTTINIIEVITGAETLTISADLSIPENGSALEALWVNTGIVAEIIRMAAVVMTVPTMANITMTVPQMSNVIMTV